VSEKVKLYAVEWTDNRPSVVSVEATLDGPDLYGIPQDAPHAFGLMTPLDEVAREGLCIGTDPVDAVFRALESRKVKETALEKTLLDVRRDLTELAVLGLAEAGV
jgi:hypothetical protein